MKKQRLLVAIILVLVMVTALALVACDPAEVHVCDSKCPECGKCTNPDCKDPVCADKCPGHEPDVVETTPVISVVPAEIEMHAGEEIDLMFGVTVTDEGDDNPTLIIFDDEGFDADTEGVYTITYKAVNKYNKEATATRKVTVLEALSPLSLEVRTNFLGEQKWPQGNFLNFKNSLYVELNEDTNYDVAKSGVFHNASDEEITLNMAGGYGCSAIIDANGVVIEGRDGANGRLVNAENPTRTTSSVTTMEIDGETVSVASAFAKQMVIPAGGYAIIVQNQYAGTTVDSDGRGFMNYNVIYAYGNVVRLFWVEDQTELTSYVDQAPVISGHTTTVYAAISDASFVLDTEVLAGVTALDDNGTFSSSDDQAVTVTITDNGGFDISKAGQYTITLTATDGTKEATATRIVEVITDVAEITINGKSIKMMPESIAVDQDLDMVGKYLFILYTPAYEGALEFANGYGEAFVIDRFGKVARIYDGANGKYYDAQNPAGIVDASKCTPAGYALEAFESLQDGEYLLIAPNSGANVSRKFLLDNRAIGVSVTLPNIEFEAKTFTFEVNGKQFTVEESKYAFNKEVTAADAPKYGMIVYNKTYAGTVALNGYGVAVVVDQYGNLVKVYDGANGGSNIYTTDGKVTGTFNSNNYATVAFSLLAEGETLIVFPNDGVNDENSARTFGLGLRMDGSLGQKVTLTDVNFAEKPKDVKSIVIDDKFFTADEGRWLYNTEVESTNVYKYQMLIFDKAFTGTIATNGNGAVLVLDKYGVLVKIYDGANLGFYTVDGKSTEPLTFNQSNYAEVAFSELQEGEMMLVFPNDGSTNVGRAFALSLRGVGGGRAYCGEKATLTGFEFESNGVYITIGENEILFDPAKVAVNTTTANANEYDWYVFSTAFAGTLNFANGWGCAIVMDANDNIVRIYSGADAKYYDAENPTGIALDSANYLTIALNSLKNNEWMLVGINGTNQAPRDFLRSNGKLGSTVTIEDVDVQKTDKAMMSVAVGNKIFFTTAIAVNQEVSNPATYDFAVYTYGHSGVILKNGWSEAFVFGADGNITKIYDGVNNKFYDATNTSGVAGADYFQLASCSLDAFLQLEAGETLVVGLNGGLDGNRARAFFVSNRTFGAKMTVSGLEATASSEEVSYVALTVGSKTWYQDMSKMAINADFEGTPVFAIYDYGFTGTAYTGAYGVALVVDKETGKTVRVYDGANGKYWDAENNGVAGICTATGYAAEAFESLQEGEYVVIAPNLGGANISRGFLSANRAVGVAVSYVLPEVAD